MSSYEAIKAGMAYVSLGAKVDESSVRGASQHVTNLLERGLQSIGISGGLDWTAPLRAYGTFVARAMKESIDLEKQSVRTGISVEDLQRISRIAEEAGMDVGAFVVANNRLRLAIARNAPALRELKLGLKDFVGKSDLERMLMVEQALDGMANGIRRDALAFGLFGRAGINVSNVLRANADDIKNIPVANRGAISALATLGRMAKEWIEDQWTKFLEGEGNAILGKNKTFWGTEDKTDPLYLIASATGLRQKIEARMERMEAQAEEERKRFSRAAELQEQLGSLLTNYAPAATAGSAEAVAQVLAAATESDKQQEMIELLQQIAENTSMPAETVN